MRLGGIALIRRRLDTVDRQRGQHGGRAAERLLVDSQRGSSVLGDLSRQRASLGILRVCGLGRAQADRLRADPLAANNLLFLRHVPGILPWGETAIHDLQRQSLTTAECAEDAKSDVVFLCELGALCGREAFAQFFSRWLLDWMVRRACLLSPAPGSKPFDRALGQGPPAR